MAEVNSCPETKVPPPQMNQGIGLGSPPPYPMPAVPMACASPPTYQPPTHVENNISVVVAAQPAVTRTVVELVPVASYCGEMVFACIVLWCCNWIAGLIAFFLAVRADNNKVDNPSLAHSLGRASKIVSIVGIIVTVVVLIAVGSSSSGKDPSSKPTPSTSTGRYVSPYSCCSSKGYDYVGSDNYCYGGRSSTFPCPNFYFSEAGKCYRTRYQLSASLCCYSNEHSYNTSTHYCY